MKTRMHSSSHLTQAKILRKTRKPQNLHKNRPKPSTKHQKITKSANQPTATSIIIQKMQQHEDLLRSAVRKAQQWNKNQNRTYKRLVKYYEDQQSILEARREMMMNNCEGYKSLVASMQHVIITLRGRLQRFQMGVESDDDDEEETDEGFCDNEE